MLACASCKRFEIPVMWDMQLVLLLPPVRAVSKCGGRSPPASGLAKSVCLLCSCCRCYCCCHCQLYVLSASAAAAASPAEPNKLALQLLMPRAGLLATPLYTKRLCHVPLAEALLKPGGMAAGQVCPSDALAPCMPHGRWQPRVADCARYILQCSSGHCDVMTYVSISSSASAWP
jgi:hypothetical protein